MLGPQLQLRVFAMAVVTLALAWVLTPWLGFMAFLYVPALVIGVHLGLVAVWTIEDWLRELREGRQSRGGGVR